MSCVNGVSRRMRRGSSTAAAATISSETKRPVAASSAKKSKSSESATFERIVTISVIGPVGRSTSSGWPPSTACAIPASEFMKRYSARPMRLLEFFWMTTPSATVEKTVAKNMKSADESVFDQWRSAVA